MYYLLYLNAASQCSGINVGGVFKCSSCCIWEDTRRCSFSSGSGALVRNVAGGNATFYGRGGCMKEGLCVAFVFG